MSGLEIERKFLVRKDGRPYVALAYAATRMSQGYICSASGRTVRVRIAGDKAFLTIKGPSDASGMSRYEFEREITLDEGESLMRLCEPGVIDKTRYYIRCGRHVFEVDEFHGENAGLVIAEVELGSEDEPFERPDFLGDEVTGDRRFYNSSLRMAPFTTWSDSVPAEYR